MDEYKRLHTFGKFFGIESHVLSPEETKKLYPLMNVTDIYGTLYSPADGTIDPNGICQATTRFAKQKGAKVKVCRKTTPTLCHVIQMFAPQMKQRRKIFCRSSPNIPLWSKAISFKIFCKKQGQHESDHLLTGCGKPVKNIYFILSEITSLV